MNSRQERRREARRKPVPRAPAVVTKPARSILFGVPSHSGDLSYGTFHALMSAGTEAHARGWTTDLVVRAHDFILTRARDVLLATFLTKDCTDLIMVDGDIGWDYGSISRLMDHPVDLVGGAYPGRGDPPEFVLQTFKDALYIQVASGLCEVAGAPTGFLRISRACAQRLTDHYAADWYTDERTAPGLRMVSLFQFQLIDHVFHSEDYVFCKKWRDIGGKVWIDTDLTLHHAGAKVFSGCFHKFLDEQLRAQGQAPPAAAAAPGRVPSILDLARTALELGKSAA